MTKLGQGAWSQGTLPYVGRTIPIDLLNSKTDQYSFFLRSFVSSISIILLYLDVFMIRNYCCDLYSVLTFAIGAMIRVKTNQISDSNEGILFISCAFLVARIKFRVMKKQMENHILFEKFTKIIRKYIKIKNQIIISSVEGVVENFYCFHVW